MFDIEIYIKGEEEPTYVTGTQSDINDLEEFLGRNAIRTYDNRMGSKTTILLKDAYAFDYKEIETDPLEEELNRIYEFEGDE